MTWGASRKRRATLAALFRRDIVDASRRLASGMPQLFQIDRRSVGVGNNRHRAVARREKLDVELHLLHA